MSNKKDLPILDEKHFLTCDPGSGGTGLALFSPEYIFPIDTHVVKSPVSNWWMNRKIVLFGVDEYLMDMKERGCKKFFIEKPAFMESGKGLTAARSDSLVKLVVMYGTIVYLAEQKGYEVENISIVKWKGQMNKDMVNIRLKHILGVGFDDHISDAVGMGLWLKGKFSTNK